MTAAGDTANSDKEPRHCNEYINDFHAPKELRWFLLVQSLTAVEQMLFREFSTWPRLFADHDGKRVRVVMASRLGDVGITDKLEREDGYQLRVYVDALTNFSASP